MLRADVQFRLSPRPDYIYGRYVLGSRKEPELAQAVSETFFPVVWAPDGRHMDGDAARTLRHSGLLLDEAGTRGIKRPSNEVVPLLPPWPGDLPGLLAAWTSAWTSAAEDGAAEEQTSNVKDEV